MDFIRYSDSSTVRQRTTQKRKLDVQIEKEIQEPSGGGIGSIIFKLLILLLVVGVVLFVVGLSINEGPAKLITGDDGAGND